VLFLPVAVAVRITAGLVADRGVLCYIALSIQPKTYPMSIDENRRLDREFSRNSARHIDFNNELNCCVPALLGGLIQ